MEKRNTRDVFERIHDDMRAAISVEFNDSLQRILNELSSLEVLSQSGRQIRIFQFHNGVLIQADVIEKTLDKLRNSLFTGFGLSMAGGGAVYADIALTGGIVSAVLGGAGVVAIFIKVFREYISLQWLLPGELKEVLSQRSLADTSARWSEEFGPTAPQPVVELTRRLFEVLSAEQAESLRPVIVELGRLDSNLPLDPLVWQRAVVFLDSPWAELGVEWVDLPGLGHTNPLHRWMTEQALATARRSFLLVELRGATETTLDLLAALDTGTWDSMALVFSRIDEIAAHGEERLHWSASMAPPNRCSGWDNWIRPSLMQCALPVLVALTP